MKRVIIIIFGLLITKSSIARSEEFLLLHKPLFVDGFIWSRTYEMLIQGGKERQYIIDQIPTKRVSTDNNGDFYLTNTERVCFREFESLSEICKDTIDGRKTFYFEDKIYTEKDIVTIRTIPNDVHDDYRYLPNEEIWRYAYGVRGTIINGKKEGLWEIYKYGYETNYTHVKIIDENYRDGLLHGTRFCYDHYGKRVSSELFFNGTGYCRYHYPDGKLAVKGAIVNGKRYGYWVYYDQQGVETRIEQYDTGLLHGRLVVYDSSGAELYSANFKHGTGQYREYKGNRITLEGSMINGLRVGRWTEIYRRDYPYFETENLGVIEDKKWHKNYKNDDPMNNPKCILDQTYLDGKWVYVMVEMDK